MSLIILNSAGALYMRSMMVVCFYPLHVLTGRLNIGGEPRKYFLINDDEQ
jgi:hypothetical protein